MAQDDQRPIVIKKVEGDGGDGHHGGAWKIAYADFVTAMMAFFLLMWLLNATTEERRKGIAEFFNPMADKAVKMPTEAILEAKPSPLTGGSRVKTIKDGKSDATVKDKNKNNFDKMKNMIKNEDAYRDIGKNNNKNLPKIVPIGHVEDSKVESDKIKSNIDNLKNTIMNNGDTKDMYENLDIKFYKKDIRIELKDTDKKSMFDLGASTPNQNGKKMLNQIGAWLSSVPENISVIGYTDRANYKMGKGWSMSNWTLSALRADHAREILVEAGYPDGHILDVVGGADRELAVPEDPSSPSNRRIVIVIHRRYPLND